MIKIAFFDIDWTLYDHRNHRWDKQSLAEIKKLQSSGVKCYLCTARPYNSFYLLGAYDQGIIWDGYVASNGGLAVVGEDRYILKDLMDPETVKAYISLLKTMNETGEFVTLKNRKLLAPLTPSAQRYYDYFVDKIPEVGEYDGGPVTGLNVFVDESKDRILKTAFPGLIQNRYFEYALDVMPTVHEKGLAVDAILDYHGYSKDQALGFGDDYQDLSLCHHVGAFVAMGNGIEELNKVATIVTYPVWDAGVGFALKKLGLV